jgi:hypothetical protein
MPAHGGIHFQLRKIPEVVKYGRCEPENMEIALEALRNSDVGLNAVTHAYHLRNDT